MARLAIVARISGGHIPVTIAIEVVTSSFKRFETCKLSLHSERYRERGRHLIHAPGEEGSDMTSSSSMASNPAGNDR
jgi:hypothetical protein